MEGVGTPNGKRHAHILTEDQVGCQTNCQFVIGWNMTDMPLISSDPNCPIEDFKLMQDDGFGNPTHEPNPLEIKIEKMAIGT
jgi:hypothetical protein